MQEGPSMADFRSFKSARRLPAEPMQPVVDPAGWSPQELNDVESWSYRLTKSDTDELAGGIAAVRRRGIDMVDIKRDDFPLSAFGEVLRDVRRELLDGRGIV